MKVVSDIICPFAQRVIGVLELKAVDCEFERIALLEKPDWLLKISPNGQIPILIEGQDVLFESSAICEYLDEMYPEPRLHPLDPLEKARHRAWEMLAANNYLVQCRAMRSPSADIFEYRKSKLFTAFEKVEAVLGEDSILGPTRPSLVDAAWYPLLHRAALVLYYTGFDFLSDFAKVKQWQLELMKVDALANSVPKDFERAFVDFYLNDQTYLGWLMTRYCAAWPPA